MDNIQELFPFKSTCTARVDVMSDGSYQNAVPHTYGRLITESASPPATEDDVPTVVDDVIEKMKAEVDVLAFSKLNMTSVYRIRNAHFGSAIYRRVEVPPLSMTKTGDVTFVQFHYTYMDNGEVQHILGWGHPALIRLLFYHRTVLYRDDIFHCVLSQFYQCIIVIVHDRGSKCAVLCMTLSRLTSQRKLTGAHSTVYKRPRG
ncbi:hypothetical protein PHMEG_00023685 [Phytophthora megakarya]|uniref:Uncharacterized protein n=1 Tax=Phytophthora megakarya TaxID=4795 RepID=A0A225VFS7_9STRA|nr:hypothetical protein PHMEG_00023685 [Phytophthora megakarya]